MTPVVVKYIVGYIIRDYWLRVPYDYLLHIAAILSSDKVLVREIVTKLGCGSAVGQGPTATRG